MAAFEELQVTEASCCTLPSLKVPLAIILCEVPAAMLGFAGVTAMDTSPGGVSELGRYSSADAVIPFWDERKTDPPARRMVPSVSRVAVSCTRGLAKLSLTLNWPLAGS